MAPSGSSHIELSHLSHFSHLANATTDEYSFYSLEGWSPVDFKHTISIQPGDFVIMRASKLEDRDCVGLARLIRRYHREVEAASVGHDHLELHPVPRQYRRGYGDNVTGHESDPTF